MELLPTELQSFGERDFNKIAFTSQAIKSGQINENLSILSSSLNSLDKELNSQVSLHHEELLQQVNNVKDLESMLNTIQSGVDKLHSNVSKISKEIKGPTAIISEKTKQLGRIQETSDLLRKINRFLLLAGKLKGHLQGGNRELSKAAQCLHELEMLRKESTLSLGGIQIVDSEVRWILKANEDVTNISSRMLIQGLETQNQMEVSSALQVFYNLGMLRSKVDASMAMIGDRLSKAISNTFSPLNNEENRSHVWTRIEKLMDTLHVCCIQIWHLQRVLSKTKSTNHSFLIDELVKQNQPSIVQIFWRDFTLKLTQRFQSSLSSGSFIENTFSTEFPKLNRFFHDFLKRLQNHYEMKQSKTNLSLEDQNLFLNSLQQYRQSFQKKSFSRMTEFYNKVFIGHNTLPTMEDNIKLLDCICEEIENAQSSTEELGIIIAKLASEIIHHFATKIESLIATTEAVFNPELCSPYHSRNIKLFNLACHFHFTLTSIFPSSSYVRDHLSQSLAHLEQSAFSIINPLFSKLTNHLEQSILAIHKEDFDDSSVSKQVQTCSPYIKNIQTQIYNVYTHYISKLTNGVWLKQKLNQLGQRLLKYFLRHATLIRPLGESGKLKLTADMAQFELAVATIQPLNTLGSAYQELRALRSFVFKELDQIPNCSEKDILPPSSVFHHLFSRAPSSLLLPHQLHKWNIAQYSDWMDQHTENQIWNLLKECLDSYASQVNAKGEKQFTPIYPIILDLAPNLLKQKPVE
eukprot:TRINITY_DN9165_c0_g1_i2.p1 TRINITY_DN9165_c0_g1~~TRINITY_DN9165_c0_g1_i2.p1  ORF type:complete len:748 (-),score=194.71 TRINITY_DN9165_c0_g1_i2:48-2291(-)